jgi:2-C-methyl-D-erythritol 4-phosphate cytidylyltransferase
LHPRLVMGSASNLKVTQPGDWDIAEICLKSNTYD